MSKYKTSVEYPRIQKSYWTIWSEVWVIEVEIARVERGWGGTNFRAAQ